MKVDLTPFPIENRKELNELDQLEIVASISNSLNGGINCDNYYVFLLMSGAAW